MLRGCRWQIPAEIRQPRRSRGKFRFELEYRTKLIYCFGSVYSTAQYSIQVPLSIQERSRQKLSQECRSPLRTPAHP